MNLSRSFSFGSLIKTFLPGLVLLAAVLMIMLVATRLSLVPSGIWTFLGDHEQAALVVAVPLAALLGLLSNVIVFMGVNDKLVRNPVRQENKRLFALYDLVSKQICEQYWDHISCEKKVLKDEFLCAVDVELVMLPAIGVEKISYVREQYWYHLEFQINLILSIALLFVASIALVLVSGLSCSSIANYGLFSALFFAGFLTFMVKAARKNYHRHICKMLSLMTSFLCSMEQSAPRAARSTR